MKNNKDSVQIFNKGVGFFGLLGLLFIGLKLGGVINWSWIWVLSPIWLSFSVKLLTLIILIIFVVIGTIITKNSKDSDKS